MDLAGRLDPELAALQVLLPTLPVTDIARARTLERRLTSQQRVPPDVSVSDLLVPRDDGSTLGLRLYRQATNSAVAPVLLFLHGGGFITGGMHSDDQRCAAYVTGADCTVVALSYRLAPEHPFPAASQDCYDTLLWLVDHAQELRIDSSRLAVGGLSAGGALAAGLALRARDLDGPRLRLRLQMLLHPMIDNDLELPSAVSFTNTPVLRAEDVAQLWSTYLPAEGPFAPDGAGHYACPGLADDVAGLPPAFISTAEFDPLRDNALRYARRLLYAGVSVELHQYAGTFHSFDSLMEAKRAQRAISDQVLALKAALTA